VVLASLSLAALAEGCAAQGAGEWANVPRYYYEQKRTDTIAVKGFKRLTIEGDNCEVLVPMQLAPLSILQQQNGTWDAIKDVLTFGLGAWVTHDAVHDLAKRPQVVQQQVVRPEVVTVTP